MRRLAFAVALLAGLSACGSSGSTPSSTDQSTSTQAPQPSCVATQDAPSLGTVAVTGAYRVRLWNTAGADGYREFEQIGDDPQSTNTGGDLTVVETVAVVPQTCAIFAGACCEPVSGVTYYGGDSSGEWNMLFGRLPTVSPDGDHLAVVGWDSLTVSTTQAPDVAVETFKIPAGDSTVMIDSMWIDNDRLVLLGYTDVGTYIWLATLSNGDITPAVLITEIVNSTRADINLVHLAGVDDKGNIMVIRPIEDGQEMFSLAPEMMDATSSQSFPGVMLSYFDNGVRATKVDVDGNLTIQGRGDSPQAFGAGYLWAR